MNHHSVRSAAARKHADHETVAFSNETINSYVFYARRLQYLTVITSTNQRRSSPVVLHSAQKRNRSISHCRLRRYCSLSTSPLQCFNKLFQRLLINSRLEFYFGVREGRFSISRRQKSYCGKSLKSLGLKKSAFCHL